jgi:multidrug efflux pump subunit AcrA (membrane-fusion protein)
MAVLALAAGLDACGGGEPAKPAAFAAPVPVETLTLAPVALPEIYEATGTVHARVSSTLSARTMGNLREVRVQAGDTVKAGQVLAVIDSRDADTGLRQAEAAAHEAEEARPESDSAVAAAKAQFDLAESTHARMKSLFDDKSITAQEYDEAQARLRVAQAGYQMAQARRRQFDSKIRQAGEAVAQAKLQKGYAEIVAPFNGIVIERKAEPGMLAAPGTPVLVVEQSGVYRLEAAVEESRLGQIHPGTAVAVRLDAFGKDIAARVAEIVPALDPGSRSFTVKIDLPGQPGLRSGMYGRALFHFGERQALAVPPSAIVREGQLSKVYVIDAGTARARLLTTGAGDAARVEILSGLAAGERIAARVPPGLSDGSRVEVRP